MRSRASGARKEDRHDEVSLDGLLNDQSLFMKALEPLMQNKNVELDVETLSSLLQTSRSGMKAVMRVGSRVQVLQERTLPIAIGMLNSFVWGLKGKVYACGNHTEDQLEETGVWREIPMPDGVSVKQIIAGFKHSFLITKAGELYACGSNECGQLGLGHKRDQESWIKVELPEGVAIKQVITGVWHSFLITQTGELYACGWSTYGVLGLGYRGVETDWIKVELPEGVTMKQVITGANHSFLITQTGELYACGLNRYGQLGQDHNENQPGWKKMEYGWIKVDLPEDVSVKQVIAGKNHSFLITQSGELYACGDNEFGQLGLGHQRNQKNWIKVELPDGVELKQVITGANHSFLITQTGELYACGMLGLSHGKDQNQWRKLPLQEGVAMKQGITGANYCFLITQSGGLYAYGDAGFEQLGLSHQQDQRSWVHVELPKGFSFRGYLQFLETLDTVQKYPSSDPSDESMRELVNALTEEQLLLLPYHLRAEQALDLNKWAYREIYYPGVSAASSASASVLVDQSIFSKLEDNGVDYSGLDPSENYLVMYKRSLGSVDSAVAELDANDDEAAFGGAARLA